MTDFKNLKEVLEHTTHQGPPPNRTRKPKKKTEKAATGIDTAPREEPDADFEKTLLKVLEKGEKLNPQQLEYIDQQLATNQIFRKKYQNAHEALLKKKRLELRRKKAKAIKKHISENNPELYEILQQRKKKVRKLDTDKKSEGERGKPLKFRVSREIARQRVTAAEWRNIYKTVHLLEISQKSALPGKAADTNKAAPPRTPIYTTNKIKKDDHIRSGTLTIKTLNRSGSLSGSLRLSSKAKSIALLLSNGTRIDLASDENRRVKFDDIELVGTINMTQIFYIIPD